jgi:SnoaL-like domain
MKQDFDVNRALCGRDGVVEAGSLFVHAIDLDERYFDQCLSEDVEVIYSFGRWRGREEHKRRCRLLKDTFAETRHMLSNPLIKIDGLNAKASWYVFAMHILKGKEADGAIYAGCVYHQDLIFLGDAWLIKRHQCDAAWQDDPAGFFNSWLPATFRT